MRNMAILMTELCEKGVELIWKQCDEDMFSQGLDYLEEAVRAGDPEALFFLGHCYSWGDGAVGFNDMRAYECYKEGARAGSYRCVLGALRAGRYDENLKEIAAHTLEECYEEVLKAATEGDPFAAYQIGAAYEWEDVSALLADKALKTENCLPWYEKAAQGGIVGAMVKAGKCYLNGRFANRDVDKGIYYADQAASRGDAWGLYRMGVYYQEKKNEEAAFEYFRAAASQGDKKAPYRLGCMYLHGWGTERNVGKAIEHFEQAAAREDTACLIELGDIYYNDEVVERNDERCFYWYCRAYAAGDKRAALPLARLYVKSWENQDYQKAEKLFLEAARDETDGSASLALGNFYLSGKSGTADAEQALKYYRAGAEMGNAECMELLGNFYYTGNLVDKNSSKAFYWLNKCLQAGTLYSFSNLAHLYLDGEGCEADEERAIELFELASETEFDGSASYELGYIYERRGESQEDLEIAAEYYQDAIEMGNESAMRRFSHFKKTMFGKWKVQY